MIACVVAIGHLVWAVYFNFAHVVMASFNQESFRAGVRLERLAYHLLSGIRPVVETGRRERERATGDVGMVGLYNPVVHGDIPGRGDWVVLLPVRLDLGELDGLFPRVPCVGAGVSAVWRVAMVSVGDGRVARRRLGGRDVQASGAHWADQFERVEFNGPEHHGRAGWASHWGGLLSPIELVYDRVEVA